jgi:hypothetical protein
MSLRWLGIAFAPLFLLGIQSVAAQPMNGCPAGQAMQSSDPSGKKVTCVPIPDTTALQGQINGEAAARTAADAGLQKQINDEAAARMAADAELRASINEASIVGRYAVTGTRSCVSSQLGFNDDLTPKPGTPATPGTPAVTNFVQYFSVVTVGVRTFNADGTGTTRFQSQAILAPSTFFTATGGAGVSFFLAPPQPSGGGSVADVSGTFTWQVLDGKLIINSEPTIGTFTRGGRTGFTVETRDVPKLVGMLGKDLRTISVTHEDLGVETSIQTSPDGLQVQTSPRVCARDSLLRKLAD